MNCLFLFDARFDSACVAGTKALRKKKEGTLARLASGLPLTLPPALPYAQAYRMRDFGAPSNATTFYSSNMPVAAAVPALRWQPPAKLL